jgi:hypothetical protein
VKQGSKKGPKKAAVPELTGVLVFLDPPNSFSSDEDEPLTTTSACVNIASDPGTDYEQLFNTLLKDQSGLSVDLNPSTVNFSWPLDESSVFSSPLCVTTPHTQDQNDDPTE